MTDDERKQRIHDHQVKLDDLRMEIYNQQSAIKALRDSCPHHEIRRGAELGDYDECLVCGGSVSGVF